MKFVGCVSAEVKLPRLCAGEAVRWAVGAPAFGCCGAWAEPREDDRNAAAYGFTGSEGGLLRKEEHRLLVRRLPRGDMRAMEVEFGAACGRRDACADEAAVFVEGE